jgi:hypothetical protein
MNASILYAFDINLKINCIVTHFHVVYIYKSKFRFMEHGIKKMFP